MKALVKYESGIGNVEIREVEEPVCGRDQIKIEVGYCGICGTDLSVFHDKFRNYPPVILGHEIVGYIEQIGKEAEKQYGVKKGDRVVVESIASCGYCTYCIEGNYKFCENQISYGFHTSTVSPHLWGAYGQYLYLCPGSKVHKIPKDIPAEAAVLINATLANSVQWLRIIGGVSTGATLVIQGTGPQGLSAVIAAKESGASPIIITGLTADIERFKLAKEFGAGICINAQEQDPVQEIIRLTKGKKADMILDVTGSPEGIVNSIRMVKPRGTVICAGTTGVDKQTVIPIDEVVLNEIKLQGVFTCTFEAVAAAIKIIESRQYQIEKLVTHRFSLEEAEKAVQSVAGQIPGIHPLKAVILPWS